jgi:hypothetical protein
MTKEGRSVPSYTLTKHGDRVDPGPVQVIPTHEITVTWEEGEGRPPFLPPGGVIDLQDGRGFWQIITPILYAANGAEPECHSYLVRGVTP